jgi:hypothetical protein
MFLYTTRKQVLLFQSLATNVSSTLEILSKLLERETLIAELAQENLGLKKKKALLR